MDTGLFRLIRIDDASPHLATLAGWAHDEWGHLNPCRGLAAAVEAFRADCGPAGVPSVFVVLHEGRPVGMASLVVDDMSDRTELTPWLASVYVRPEWRGRGIASRLVRRVEEEAQAHGHRRFYLYTPDQQALYRRLGWKDLEDRRYRGEAVTKMLDMPRTFSAGKDSAGAVGAL
ncbi:GNAT family N-acetyltransferase [Halomonas urmiana]|uniref:GNAT family N-acetyltransferase n=1 Tax=Halomonas urmiana TaxID=490901 RepID=A0A5R8M924_9GAMM|nr:GNAT family N-acetyltransferase [Halomonas urmiana]TLF46007.1 GNAT family N-acetyltransferase [Halomonas urmiana]